MQIALFQIMAGDAAALEELNRFLRGHRILTLDRQWNGSGWSLCVSYQAGTSAGGGEARGKLEKVDYRAVLDASTFALYSRLREARKLWSEKEGLPPYAVFTNEQLAGIAKARCDSPAALEKVEGVGPARVAKYAAPVIEIVTQHEKLPNTSGANR